MPKLFWKSVILIYVLAPVALYWIPLDWLNKQPTICLFKNIFGKDCYGCGLTRSVISLIQLDFKGAIGYNQLIVIVMPLLVYNWIKGLQQLINKNNSEKKIMVPGTRFVVKLFR